MVMSITKLRSITFFLAITTVLLLLTTTTLSSTSSGVMQITLNNLKKVLATYEQVHILFHNPQCVHSRKYVEQFLKVNQNNNNNQGNVDNNKPIQLGIVDCIRELQLCQQHNLTVFPVLVRYGVNNDKQNDNGDNNDYPFHFTIIDEQQFLIQHQNIQQQQQNIQLSDQYLANKFVNYLSIQPYYAIVIFQDYALPVEEKQRLSPTQQSRVFYLQPSSSSIPSSQSSQTQTQTQKQSQFSKLLSSFVNNRNGCWIFKKTQQNQLQKYACDSGYSKNITMKYLKMFTQNKLKKYVFQQEESTLLNNKVVQQQRQQQQQNIRVTPINSQQAHQLLTHQLNTQNTSPCGLLYISSRHCPSCRSKDIQSIKMAINQLHLSDKLELFKFDVDRNLIPKKLVDVGLKRVPQVIYICDNKIRVFGRGIFVETVKEFIQRSHQGQQLTSQKTILTEPTTKQSSKIYQNNQQDI